MAWFFSENVSQPTHIITGEDANHITASLRMKEGEQLTICDKNGIQHNCTIEHAEKGLVSVHIDESYPCRNEPHTFVTLYQALAKGDKMEFIIQKAVELGVKRIVPMLTDRCVSRPDEKSMKKKLERWNKIALQAAQQSRRGEIPVVMPLQTLKEAAKNAGNTAVVCYELGGEPLGVHIEKHRDEISLFIGSEGGFEIHEIDEILKNGGAAATLGNRILRAETAPIAALSVIMYLTDNLGSVNDIKRDDNGKAVNGGEWHF